MQLPYSNMRMNHWNEGATMPLILPVHVICNTSDEEIYSNIRTNSHAKPYDWIRLEAEQEGMAILCGSGPSLADCLDDIRSKQEIGGKVFAMNGAAAFLASHGIVPDYQVIIDARKATADLIGPAKEHLFASQVHPECFKRVPTARLWHLQIGNIENEFPEYEEDYCLIGGAASVGNTATCLAFAMGYRDLQIYGYDSSHRGEAGHAFRQPLNDGDPCCHVTFNGREFVCSLTMKLQAEKFQETAQELVASGCKVEVHGDGLLPEMWRNPKVAIAEDEKYRLMWQREEYRHVAPGEDIAPLFVEVVKPEAGRRIVDYGCGTGRGSLALRKLTECEVVQVDFTDNSRDENARDFLFYQADLTQKIQVLGDYGYCTDVMEHIAPENVDQVIKNILDSSPRAFFQISTVPDVCGSLIGEQLHLTVRPHSWWRDKFVSLGYAVRWEKEESITALFYVSSTGDSTK